MKKLSITLRKFFNKKKFKYGGYAAGMTALVITVILLVNLLVTTMDEKFDLSVDLTANRVYSLTLQSKHILEELSQDIYIYTLFSQGYEDETLSELLERYKGKSEFIHISNIDMVKSPGVVSYYENVKGVNLSGGGAIISTSDDPTDPTQSFKIIDGYDIYGYDSNTESFSLFTGEDAITGAILYVLNPNIPKVWFLEGHGTTSANWAEMRSFLEDENYDTGNLSLVKNQEDLEKGDILIVVGPTVDLSNDEREILLDFALDGGKIMFIFNPVTTIDLPNFKKILSFYNIQLEDGFILEDVSNTSSYYYEQSYLVPKFNSHEITNALRSSNILMLLPFSGAVEIGASQGGITINTLIESSDKSYLEPAAEDADFEKNEGAKEGPFPLAVAIRKNATVDEEEVQIVIVMSENAFYNMSQMTAGNDEFFLNAISWLNPIEDDFYIRGKSVKASVLYFQTTAQILTVIVIVSVIIPLIAFIMGIAVFLRRRHL